MSEVAIGIIGIGGMGSIHVKHLTNGDVPGTKLAAVCDIKSDRLEWARATLGDDVRRFGNAADLFAAKVVDAIIVATPHYFHPELVMQSLDHDLHVLSEKPAGVYTRQVREMNERAAGSDKKFAVMFNQRSHSEHLKLRELVHAGEIGEVLRTNYIITDWFRAQSYYDAGGWRATWSGEGGGVLANQCPHNLDLWQWICGMPKRVRAFIGFGKYHDIEVDDDVTAYVEYESGATGLFVTTTGEAPGTNRLEITGDRGKLLLENGQITFWRTSVPVSQFRREYQGGFGSPEVWKCDISASAVGEGHVGILKNWIGAILRDEPLLAAGQEGINGVELSNAMLLSAWLDDWVDIPVNEDQFYAELQDKIANSTVEKEDKDAVMDTDGTFGT
jgi:predicted dehydrogenase